MSRPAPLFEDVEPSWPTIRALAAFAACFTVPMVGFLLMNGARLASSAGGLSSALGNFGLAFVVAAPAFTSTGLALATPSRITERGLSSSWWFGRITGAPVMAWKDVASIQFQWYGGQLLLLARSRNGKAARIAEFTTSEPNLLEAVKALSEKWGFEVRESPERYLRLTRSHKRQ